MPIIFLNSFLDRHTSATQTSRCIRFLLHTHPFCCIGHSDIPRPHSIVAHHLQSRAPRRCPSPNFKSYFGSGSKVSFNCRWRVEAIHHAPCPEQELLCVNRFRSSFTPIFVDRLQNATRSLSSFSFTQTRSIHALFLSLTWCSFRPVCRATLKLACDIICTLTYSHIFYPSQSLNYHVNAFTSSNIHTRLLSSPVRE